jgi:hypothetical protein
MVGGNLVFLGKNLDSGVELQTFKTQLCLPTL